MNLSSAWQPDDNGDDAEHSNPCNSRAVLNTTSEFPAMSSTPQIALPDGRNRPFLSASDTAYNLRKPCISGSAIEVCGW